MNNNLKPLPTDKIVLMYHGTDFDGKCSAAVAYNFYVNHVDSSQIKLIPLERGFESYNIEDLRKAIVVMMDYSLAPEEMFKIKNVTKEFHWIDHHATAIDDVEKYCKGNNKEPFIGLYPKDNSVGACGLTYQYFFDPYLPLPVKLLAKYDVCTDIDSPDNHPFMLCFQYGLKSRNTTDPRNKLWKSIVTSRLVDTKKLMPFSEPDSFDCICLDGNAIIKYETFLSNEKIKLHGAVCSLYCEDKLISNDVFVLNESIPNPILSNALKKKHQITAIYNYRIGVGFKISLYSDKVHVGEICKKFGGGGHAGAAGFRTKKLPFVLKR